MIEHVKVEDLPNSWRAKLVSLADAHVTVRSEEETQVATPAEEFAIDDPLFGMWRGREGMADVAGYIPSIWASRFNDDGTRRKD